MTTGKHTSKDIIREQEYNNPIFLNKISTKRRDMYFILPFTHVDTLLKITEIG